MIALRTRQLIKFSLLVGMVGSIFTSTPATNAVAEKRPAPEPATVARPSISDGRIDNATKAEIQKSDVATKWINLNDSKWYKGVPGTDFVGDDGYKYKQFTDRTGNAYWYKCQISGMFCK